MDLLLAADWKGILASQAAGIPDLPSFAELSKSARIVTYGGQRMSMSTHLADRVRHMLCDRNDWSRFPDDVREWLEVQSERSILP